MIAQNELIDLISRQDFFPRTEAPSTSCLPVEFNRAGEDTTAQKIQRSIAYMQKHINQPLQVSTLAAMANVSPSHFFALFKQLTGSPPMDYFTRLRMRHAGDLLGSTSASVKEVAAILGYDDPFYFSRVFKAVHRIPPSRYRHSPRAAGAQTACP